MSQESFRPMCKGKGCDMVSTMHGLWGDLCWRCYSVWIIEWIKKGDEPEIKPQLSFQFPSE